MFNIRIRPDLDVGMSKLKPKAQNLAPESEASLNFIIFLVFFFHYYCPR